MKQTIIALAIAVCIQGPAQAQDWQAYFPLQVGNVWEYAVTEPTSTMRREVVGEHQVGDSVFYEMVEKWGGATIRQPRTFFARYDTAGVVAFTESTSRDSVEYPRAFPAAAFTGGEFQEWFDLRWSIGDTVYTGNTAYESYYVVDTPSRPLIFGSDSTPTDAKCLYVEGWHECYLKGVGLFSAGSLESYWLTYARLDGTSYGMDVLSTEHSYESDEFDLEVFPNPARRHVSTRHGFGSGERVELRVVNVLGEEVLRVAPETVGTKSNLVDLDISDLPAGFYLVHHLNGRGHSRAGSFVKVK